MVRGERAGVTGALGVYRDLFNPVVAAIGVSAHGYLGQRGSALDGGARVLLESPAIFLHTGLDWNARLGRLDGLIGATFPLRRGGLLERGDLFRVEWIPGRDEGFMVGLTIPLGQPLMGRTRPRRVEAELPPVPDVARSAPPRGEEVRRALAEAGEAMDALVRLHYAAWLLDHGTSSYDASVRRSREILRSVRASSNGYRVEAERYHQALERAFELALTPAATPALAPVDDPALAYGRALAERARRIALEEVVLPYNGLIGRFKRPDELAGLIGRARARFLAEYALDHGGEAWTSEVPAVMDAWLGLIVAAHRRIDAMTRDARSHWIPMALVLRADEHATQAQIDALVERALGREFESGNATLYVNAPQFQHELQRSLRQTESHHVLWTHDYRGRDDGDNPDHTSFSQTLAYLRALADGVRRYEATGQLPSYFIVIDQVFYELNDGRLWLDLLERPLTHELRLPAEFAWMADSLATLQDSLRAAIDGSERMRADRHALGEEWIESVVKVHINVTNPSDVSFRSWRLLGLPIGGDNLMRDHRKLILRDVTEADPGRGEVVIGGMGVGDHYAAATWDDRAILVQGPAAAYAMDALRRLLERHQFRGDRIPAPLRPTPFSEDRDEQIRRLEALGATARVLQTHNRTGWGQKDATFVQMLLYDLAPSGTVLYIPDSLWTSFQWMAQLVSAALRGCEVLIVAPALDHAPSSAFPQMAVMREIVSKLVVTQEELGPMIQEASGALRVGLYAPPASPREALETAEETFARTPFLRRLFPTVPDPRVLLADLGADGADGESPAWPVAEVDHDEAPQMHRKTRLIASAATLEALAASPATAEIYRAALPALLQRVQMDERASAARTPSRAPTARTPPRALEAESVTEEGVDEPESVIEQARAAPYTAVLDVFERARAAGEMAEPVLYLATGSMNKNVRSFALDAEAEVVVAGPWALQAYLDFALLSGGVVWVNGLEDVEALLPPFSTLRRWIGRLLHSVL